MAYNKTVFGLPNSDQYIWYHFFNDSIVVPYSFDTTFVITYYPDDTDFIIRKTNPAHVYLYEWENGNMVEETQNGESIKTVSYNLSYINPFYEENKYFRFSVNGSYNYVKELINAENGSSSSYEVSASTGPFPTKVEQYYSGSLAYYHYFNYLYVISDTPEIPPEPIRILSVDYYDIMGRKIPKPTRGFYIRRETTDNGIISTKHYIQ